MSPYTIASEIRRIQIGFGGIKDHPVNASLRAVLIVLDIFLKPPIFIDSENITKASMIIEGISIYVEWSLFCCQNEDRSGICIYFRGFGWKWFRLSCKKEKGGKFTYANAALDERHCVVIP